MLAFLQAKSLLSLELRLDDRVVVTLILPLIQAAINFYHQMVSFNDVKIEAVV